MIITKETQLVTSLAGKANSVGAAMHNAGYGALGLNFVYLPIQTDDCKRAIEGVRGLRIRGTSVTIPHKQTVMQHLDVVDATAQAIGAVNTVVNNDGLLIGYNSDWIGAMHALEEVTQLAGKRVVVIGTGGAARAVIYGLMQADAHVVVFGRDTYKRYELAEVFDCVDGGSIEVLQEYRDYDIVINTTSVGFGSDESIVSKEFFRPGTVAMDVVFVPAVTTFLWDAQAQGCKVVTGERMLLHQAAFQFEAFTKQPAPTAVMEAALKEALLSL